MDETPVAEVTETVAPKKSKGGRPRKVVVPAPTFTSDQFEALLGALTANKSDGLGIGKDELAHILKETAITSAQALQKAMKPENFDHPGISAMSYPEGDVARPRPVLPYELWWNAYPMHMFPETEHWRELELACVLRPGSYTVLRKDGTKMPIEVTAQRDADGKITRLDVTFTETREGKWLTPPKMVTLYQLVNGGPEKHPRQVFMAAMNEYYTITFGTVAA
jgi:hypothetical protein